MGVSGGLLISSESTKMISRLCTDLCAKQKYNRLSLTKVESAESDAKPQPGLVGIASVKMLHAL
jgi:hypothetical protein